MKYLLTDAAVRDIREIVRHIRVSQHSPQNAKLVVSRLKKQFRALAKLPTLGHVHPELQDDAARVIHVSGVLVIYDPTLKPLRILRVIHAARDLGRIDVRR
jgi:antitoxin ParD1/3/4/toxin ParE1/3/4